MSSPASNPQEKQVHPDVLDRCIVLPAADVIKQRLAEVRPSEDDYLKTRWWPKLTRLAGRELIPEGVNLVVELALADFCSGMPSSIAAVMRLSMNDWFRALLPDDADYAAVELIREDVRKATQ